MPLDPPADGSVGSGAAVGVLVSDWATTVPVGVGVEVAVGPTVVGVGVEDGPGVAVGVGVGVEVGVSVGVTVGVGVEVGGSGVIVAEHAATPVASPLEPQSFTAATVHE